MISIQEALTFFSSWERSSLSDMPTAKIHFPVTCTRTCAPQSSQEKTKTKPFQKQISRNKLARVAAEDLPGSGPAGVSSTPHSVWRKQRADRREPATPGRRRRTWCKVKRPSAVAKSKSIQIFFLLKKKEGGNNVPLPLRRLQCERSEGRGINIREGGGSQDVGWESVGR